MNILFQFDDPIIASLGGVERVTDTLAKELVRRGHNVAFLCHQKMSLLKGNVEQSATQYYIDMSLSKNRIIEKVNDIVRKHKTEILITQNPNAVQLDIAKYFPKNIKRISVCHIRPYCFDSFDKKRISEIKPINCKHRLFLYIGRLFPLFYKTYFVIQTNNEYRRIIKESDTFCFISNKYFYRITKHINVPLCKLSAIPNPNTFQVKDIVDLKDNVILWVGRVENNGKNAIGFIKMWHFFVKQKPGWKAIMIGDGPDLDKNKRYVADNKISNISFTGNISNVQDYYKIARFVVVTSWSESWSMVLTEGMSLGCIPCAYNTYEALTDIVEDGINGVIVESVDPLLMAKAIINIINQKKMDVLSTAAKMKVKQFSVERVVNQWIDLLSNL